MKGSLPTSISRYSNSPQKLHFAWLLLFSYVPLFLTSTTAIAIAAPLKISQAVTEATINRPNLNIGSQGERVSELQAALKLLGFYTGAVDGVYQDGTARAVSQFKQAAGLPADGIVDAATWQKLFPSAVATTTTATAPASTAIRPFNAPTQANNTSRSSKPEPKPATPRQSTTAKPEPKPATPRQSTTTKPEPRPATPRQSTTTKPEPRPATPKRGTNTKPQQPATPRITPTPISQRTPGIQYTAQGWPILRLGNRGAEVVKLQTELKRLGFFTASIDGDFGAATETAVKALQTRSGVAADGVAGGETWELLLRRSPQSR